MPAKAVSIYREMMKDFIALLCGTHVIFTKCFLSYLFRKNRVAMNAAIIGNGIIDV